MPTLSDNDPEPTDRSRPSRWAVAFIAVVVVAMVVLHLTGVVGPGS
jgi:hypothetical protein